MKANQSLNSHPRRVPLCIGIHPPGGFVAWPDMESASKEEQEQYELLLRRRQRRGFVAWPEKKENSNHFSNNTQQSVAN